MTWLSLIRSNSALIAINLHFILNFLLYVSGVCLWFCSLTVTTLHAVVSPKQCSVHGDQDKQNLLLKFNLMFSKGKNTAISSGTLFL